MKNTGSTSSLNLGIYFMVFNNQTWYEKTFGAQLLNLEIRKKYKKFLIDFEEMKKSMPFMTFYKKFLYRETRLLLYLQQKYTIDIEKMYKESKTYKEFFVTLKDKLTDKNDSCNLFASFLYPFMAYVSNNEIISFFSNKWVFSSENVPKMKIKERLDSRNNSKKVIEGILQNTNVKKEQLGSGYYVSPTYLNLI
jgi:hypothetical protein